MRLKFCQMTLVNYRTLLISVLRILIKESMKENFVLSI